MSDFWVNGIVSHRDKQPYVQLSTEKGMIAQLTMGQARTIALDILQTCARSEADAMLLDFMTQSENFGEREGAALMQYFRDYRAKIDQEKVERKIDDAPPQEFNPDA
jgi:hypothetical protein